MMMMMTLPLNICKGSVKNLVKIQEWSNKTVIIIIINTFVLSSSEIFQFRVCLIIIEMLHLLRCEIPSTRHKVGIICNNLLENKINV